MKIIVNHDLKLVAELNKIMEENGGYCPCAVDHNEDTKCMCKEFREQTTPGSCHCGKFIKVRE